MAKQSQAETAYRTIKQRIMKRQIKHGQPVLETELAADLNMSRTPVREALKRLEAEGHFEIISRKGAFLKSLTMDELVQCYEVSEGLEGMLAFHLAERNKAGMLSKRFFSAADDLVARMDKAYQANNITRWVDIDTEFHQHLHKECDNPFLVDFLERLQHQFDSVSLFILPFYFNDMVQANSEHRDMIKHIRNSDPIKARDVAQKQRLRLRRMMEALSQRTV